MAFRTYVVSLALLFSYHPSAFSADATVDAFLAGVGKAQLSDLAHVSVGLWSTKSPLSGATELPHLSTWILDKLKQCPSPCELRLGPDAVYQVETPALGEGERGVVYRVLGHAEPLVIKISKPDIKSLAILRAESASHQFWSTRQTAAFTVPRRLKTHVSGLYSVMQEVQGETLTDALFRLGLLQVDPLTSEVFAQENAKHLAFAEKQKIWSAVAQMIEAVGTNPEMKTSLSPNNMFVTYEPTGLIQSISLIDFGTDGTGDDRYFRLKNLNEYLKLSAVKVQGYLVKPGYTSAAIPQLQKEAEKKFKLPRLYPENAYRPLLEDIAQKLSPGTGKLLTNNEILNLPIPKDLAPRMSQGQVSYLRAKTVQDLTQTAVAMNSLIAKEQSSTVAIDLDQKRYVLKLPALGQGDRGVVYALEGTDEVIKIPKPNLASILTLMNESIGYEFWYKAALKSKAFSVPERRSLHPLGMYSVIRRDHGEPLTKMMVRYGLLTFDPVTQAATTHPERIRQMGPKNQKKIEVALQTILDIIRKNPDYGLSISPNNLHVNYADPDKKIISDVVLIDVGLGNRNASKFDAIHDLASYVELSRDRLEKYLRVGYVDKELLSLNKAPPSCQRIFAM